MALLSGGDQSLNIVVKLRDQVTRELNRLKGNVEKLKPAFQKMSLIGAASFGSITFGVKGAIEESINLNESINAVNVIFGEGADKILKFGETSAESVGLATSVFNQYSTEIGALLKDTGKPMAEVGELTTDLAVRAADMASVMNTDVSLAFSAINQAIRGETEAIRKFTGDVTDASLEQFRLSEGIDKTVREMNQQEKKLLRVALIMKQTEKFAGDFKNTSDELANSQRILRAKITNLSATIGNQFAPILLDIVEKIEPIIEKITKWVKENKELTKKLIIGAAAIAAVVAVVGALGLVLPVVITGFAFLISPIGLAIAAFTAVAVGIAFLIKKFGGFKNTLKVIGLSLEVMANIVVGGMKTLINGVVKAINMGANTVEKWANKVIGLAQKVGIDIQKVNFGIEIPFDTEGNVGNINDALDDISNIMNEAKQSTDGTREEMEKLTKITLPNLTKELDKTKEATKLTKEEMEKATKGAIKLAERNEKLTETYDNLKKDGVEALQELAFEHENSTFQIISNIERTKTSLSDLENSFKKAQQTAAKGFERARIQDIESVAEAIVAEEEKAAELRKKIAEEVDFEKRGLLQNELNIIKKSLEDNAGFIATIENQITEVKRINALSNIDRAIEEFKKKRLLALQEFDTNRILAAEEFSAKKAELQAELNEFNKKLEAEKILFEEKTAFITQKLQEAEELRREQTKETFNLTEELIKKEIKLFKALEDAINKAQSAKASRFIPTNVAGARADGGPVQSGSSFLVGERGPELFTPRRSGAIIPNHRLGGGGGNTVIINNPIIRDDSDIGRMQRMVEKSLRSVMLNTKLAI